MNQILHIFQKDARRHWPEILISLALLGLYTRRALHPWQPEESSYSFMQFFFREQFIVPALIIFWAFLIVRVVQGDCLVGDRQWWVTKPYVWWKLLAAKVLFILIFISVPLFHVQLFLLHKTRFPVLRNTPGVLGMQLGLFLVLFLSSLILGSLTKNLGHALLGVAVGFLLLFAFVWLINRMPGGRMEVLTDAERYVQDGFLIGTALAIPVWQFARRKTWAARGLLLAGLAVSASTIVLAPYGKPVEKIYSLIERRDAPVQISIRPPTETSGKRFVWSKDLPFRTLLIPVTVTGVAPGTMVMLDGINITADSLQDSRWNRGWHRQYVPIWPEDQRKNIDYEVDREEYEKIKTKPLNLHIEMAFSEYKEIDARYLPLSVKEFFDGTLGTCRINPMFSAQIQCLKPIREPGFMATFDPQKSVCPAGEDEDGIRADTVSHSWREPNDNSMPAPGLTPVDDYSISFDPVSVLLNVNSETQKKIKVAHLCPGAEIKLAKPEFKRQFRIKLDMSNVRLEDVAGASWR